MAARRSAAQIAASRKNLEKARAARKKNAPRRKAAQTDKEISKGEWGNGKVSKTFKSSPGNPKWEEKMWQKHRYSYAKAVAATGNIKSSPSQKTKRGVATTSTGKKITKPKFKRRRTTTTRKKS